MVIECVCDTTRQKTHKNASIYTGFTLAIYMGNLTALSLLQDGELCTITTPDGEREAAWNPYDWCFVFTDTQETCQVDDVIEWVAGAKF